MRRKRTDVDGEVLGDTGDGLTDFVMLEEGCTHRNATTGALTQDMASHAEQVHANRMFLLDAP